MKIHGFVYLVVGTGIAIISKIMDSQKLALFLYLGILFALYGIAKIIVEGLKRKPAPPPQARHPAGPVNGNHYVTRHHRITRTQRTFIQYCRWCGNQLRPYDNFCSRCGQKIYR
jgi:hypothetical protein